VTAMVPAGKLTQLLG